MIEIIFLMALALCTVFVQIKILKTVYDIGYKTGCADEQTRQFEEDLSH